MLLLSTESIELSISHKLYHACFYARVCIFIIVVMSMFQFSFIVYSFSLFSEYISNTYYGPGTVLDWLYHNKKQWNPCPHRAFVLVDFKNRFAQLELFLYFPTQILSEFSVSSPYLHFIHILTAIPVPPIVFLFSICGLLNTYPAMSFILKRHPSHLCYQQAG